MSCLRLLPTVLMHLDLNGRDNPLRPVHLDKLHDGLNRHNAIGHQCPNTNNASSRARVIIKKDRLLLRTVPFAGEGGGGRRK